MSFRPPSRSNRPMSGFKSNNRPTTGFRRLDTANGQKPIGSRTVGLDTNVKIENRPITQHGMTGMKTFSQSNSRKIADRNYYENELKGKLIEIVNEIDSMKQKIKNCDSDKIEISKLSKQQNTLLNEVREYEGKLADYNLALDKMRSGADIINLQESTKQILRKNDEEKMRIDAIFLERKNLESQINEIESNVNMIYDDMLNRVNNDDRFNKLYEEYERLDDLIFEKEKNLNLIQCKYAEIKNNLSSNEYSYHLKAINLQKEFNELSVRKAELEQETNGSMDADQIKEKILEKVKSDNKVLQETMDAINSTDDKMEQLQNVILQKEKDLKTMQDFSKQSHKYQQLFDRDRKMQVFMDEFDENFEKIQNEMAHFKQDNYGLMCHISQNEQNKNGKNQTDLKMDKMKNDISFKQQQKKEAEETLVYSEKELAKRQNELSKINSLDTKIQAELNNLDTKQKEYENDMKTFKSHDEIQSEYKQQKKRLFNTKMELQQKKELMEKKVLEIAQESDQINRKLNENAYHNELKEMETKISKLSQNIYSVQHSITEYKREGEYQPISDDIMAMQEQINALLLKEVQMEI